MRFRFVYDAFVSKRRYIAQRNDQSTLDPALALPVSPVPLENPTRFTRHTPQTRISAARRKIVSPSESNFLQD
jgi:hypothetical protein